MLPAKLVKLCFTAIGVIKYAFDLRWLHRSTAWNIITCMQFINKEDLSALVIFSLQALLQLLPAHDTDCQEK